MWVVVGFGFLGVVVIDACFVRGVFGILIWDDVV